MRRSFHKLARIKQKDLVAAIQEWIVLRTKSNDGFGGFRKKPQSGNSSKEAPKTEPAKESKTAKDTKKEPPKSSKSKLCGEGSSITKNKS